MIEIGVTSFIIGIIAILTGTHIIFSLLRFSTGKNKNELEVQKAEFNKSMVFWFCIGIILGIIYGQVVFKNLFLGVPAGIGIGLSMAVSFGMEKKKNMAQIKTVKNILILSMMFLIIGIGMFLIILI